MTATADRARNRVKLPLEVYRAVRGAVSERFVVGCRFLAEECIPGGSTARGCGLVRRRVRAGRDGLPLALPRGQVRGRQAAAGGLGPLSLHGAQWLRVHADRALGRAGTVRPEPGRHRAPCGRRCAPRGAGRRSSCRAASRPSSRRRSCSGPAWRTSSRPPGRAWRTPTGSGSSGWAWATRCGAVSSPTTARASTRCTSR